MAGIGIGDFCALAIVYVENAQKKTAHADFRWAVRERSKASIDLYQNFSFRTGSGNPRIASFS